MLLINEPERIKVKGYKSNDCTVNAIGNVLGVSYDLSLKALQTVRPERGNDVLDFSVSYKRTKSDFTERAFFIKFLSALSEEYKSLRAKKMTIEKFAEEYNKGDYVVVTESHAVTIIDGIIIDAWDSRKEVATIYFKIDVASSRRKLKSLSKHYKLDSDEHFVKFRKNKIKKMYRDTKAA